jgi:hypothetical protein
MGCQSGEICVFTESEKPLSLPPKSDRHGLHHHWILKIDDLWFNVRRSWIGYFSEQESCQKRQPIASVLFSK